MGLFVVVILDYLEDGGILLLHVFYYVYHIGRWDGWIWDSGLIKKDIKSNNASLDLIVFMEVWAGDNKLLLQYFNNSGMNLIQQQFIVYVY